MPAIITHYRFGVEVYERAIAEIGGTRDEADAFLIGNQGPDVLFYALADPRIAPAFSLARWLHRSAPTTLFDALANAVDRLSSSDCPIARAYTLGFLCHYLADSTIHPFVYAQQYALCDAGVPGLDRSHGSEVHATIETELDELVLTTRMDTTIGDFEPAREILNLSPRALAAIDALYAEALPALGPEGLTVVPPRLFSLAFASFRRIQGMLYSRDGVRRALLGHLEGFVRRHSYLQSLSHRNVRRETSDFDNRDHDPWVDPYLHETRHESFGDLYDAAQAKALEAIDAWSRLGARAFIADRLPALAGGRNFLGDFVEPAILDVEDGDEDESPADDGPVEVDAILTESDGATSFENPDVEAARRP